MPKEKEKEVFKRIKLGTAKFYEISNLGTVYSTARTIDTYRQGKLFKVKYKRHVISPDVDKNNGCLRIRVQNNGKNYSYLVHVLVAKTFIPNPKKLKRIRFIDDDKLNPEVSNLEWAEHVRTEVLKQRKSDKSIGIKVGKKTIPIF